MRRRSHPIGEPDFVLLRPRAGVPALLGTAPFVVESIERAAAARPTFRIESSAGGSPLEILDELTLTVADARVRADPGDRVLKRRLVRPLGAPGAGYHDLVVEPAGVRAPRAVFSRAGTAPAATVRVAQITDLHVGSGKRATQRLHLILDQINAARPDVVLVTGDVVNNGDRSQLFDAARDTLATLEAPTFVVPGNHDHGFGLRALTTSVGKGWHHFARVFHPYVHFEFELSGWSFVGFDSGPSRLSPLVRTRGLGKDDLAVIEASLARAHERGQKGTMLFSHTPSRTRLTGRRSTRFAGPLGKMSRGAGAFEELLRAAARRGQRVLHVFGHTHWTDVFELDDEHDRFIRWDHARLTSGPQTIAGGAALVNSPSASHQTMPLRRGDRGDYGFTLFELGADRPRVEFVKGPEIR